jgi:hypothetical protein
MPSILLSYSLGSKFNGLSVADMLPIIAFLDGVKPNLRVRASRLIERSCGPGIIR